MSAEREQLLIEHAKVQTQRIQLQQKLAAFPGRTRDPFAQKLRVQVLELYAREKEIERQTVALKNAAERAIGRKYAYLCKVIKHELGEASLAGFLAEADRLIEADLAAAAVEGYA